MTVLVTGATGFLGSWLTKKLCSLGHEVRVLHRQSSDLSQIEGLNLQHFIGDITDYPSLSRACLGVDRIFHLAGLIAYEESRRLDMERVNVQGTQNVVEACKERNVDKLVMMSSVVAIGAGFTKDQILNEESEFNVGHLHLGYFDTKRDAERLVFEANQKNEIQAVAVNPSTVYGPGDARKSSRKTQVKVAKGKFPFYTRGGVNITNVMDVVDATIKAGDVGRLGERYILAGENITIKQLFEYIADAAGVEPPRLLLPTPIVKSVGRISNIMKKFGKSGFLSYENALVATMYHWFDSSKAQRELGLNVTPAKETIRQSVQWMKDNNVI